DHVTGLDPGFLSGTARLDAAHRRARRLLQTQGVRDLFRDLADLNADPAPHHAAALLQLLGNLHGLIDRDGQRNAHEAAAARNDLRVHAGLLRPRVGQLTAGVAGVNGHVWLDEGQIIPGIPRLRADDARRHG